MAETIPLLALLITTGEPDGDSKLWIVVLAVVVLAPIVVGLTWRWFDRRGRR